MDHYKLDAVRIGDETQIYDPKEINLSYDTNQVQLIATLNNLLSYGYTLEYKIDGYHFR